MIWLMEQVAGKLLLWAGRLHNWRGRPDDIHESFHIYAGMRAANTTDCDADLHCYLIRELQAMVSDDGLRSGVASMMTLTAKRSSRA